MRHITQGETVWFVLTPGIDWQPAEDEAEVRFTGRAGETALLGSTGSRPNTLPITPHRNGRLSFILSPEQTVRMLGRYRIEVRIVSSGSTTIRSRWAVRIHPSAQKTTND